jgi:hypothetical protein
MPTAGRAAALREARARAGSWFDPRLVDGLRGVANRRGVLDGAGRPDIDKTVFADGAAGHTIPLDDDYLDDIAAAFGQVVDSKSPYTSGHSARVALYTDMIAEPWACPERRRWLKRGALLHDVGKLGVSNSVLDKAGALDRDEWDAVRQHAEFTETILGRIGAFAELAASPAPTTSASTAAAIRAA